MRQATGGRSGGERDDYVGNQWGYSAEDAQALAALYRSVGAYSGEENAARAKVYEDRLFMMEDGTDLCECMEPFHCYWIDEDPVGQHTLIGEKNMIVKKICKKHTQRWRRRRMEND